MKRSIDIRLIKFYLWVGLGYFFLGLFSTLGKYGDRFFPLVLNHIWGVIYVIVVNFLLFEYTIPFVVRKRRAIIYNILLGLLLLFLYMMLYSYGSYAWRLLGILLRVYTTLRIFPTVDDALANQMGYSTDQFSFLGSLGIFIAI